MSADRPTPDVETEAWWEAIDDRRLTVTRCAECGEASLYPRSFCPVCWSDRVTLEDASGSARLYTWSVVHVGAPPFSERVPYVAAVVTLDEGPRMMTEIEGCDPQDLAPDLALRVDFRDASGVTVPVFRPRA